MTAWKTPDIPLHQRLAADLAFSALAQGSVGGPRGRLLLLDCPLPLLPHILMRCEGSVVFAPRPGTREEEIWPAVGQGGWERHSIELLDAEYGPAMTTSKFEQILWVAPLRSGLDSRLSIVQALARSGALLAVVGHAPLMRIMQFIRPGVGLGKSSETRVISKRLGYETIAWWQLYGPGSATYALMRMLADRAGRADIADRLEAAFRLSLIGTGRPDLSCLAVWIGRRPVLQ